MKAHSVCAQPLPLHPRGGSGPRVGVGTALRGAALGGAAHRPGARRGQPQVRRLDGEELAPGGGELRALLDSWRLGVGVGVGIGGGLREHPAEVAEVDQRQQRGGGRGGGGGRGRGRERGRGRGRGLQPRVGANAGSGAVPEAGSGAESALDLRRRFGEAAPERRGVCLQPCVGGVPVGERALPLEGLPRRLRCEARHVRGAVLAACKHRVARSHRGHLQREDLPPQLVGPRLCGAWVPFRQHDVESRAPLVQVGVTHLGCVRLQGEYR